MNKTFDSLLVEKYRPKTLDDIVLSPENRRYFENIANKKAIPHLMFAGNPGIGKCLDFNEEIEVYVSKELKQKLVENGLLE